MSDSKRSLADLKSMIGLFKYISPYKWHFFGGMFLLVMSSSVFMLFPKIAGEMANVASGEPKYSLELGDFPFLFLGVLVVLGIASYFRVRLFAIVSEKAMAALRKDAFRKILSQDVIFFDQRRIGEVVSNLTTDVEQLQSVLSITLAEFVRQIITLTVGIIILIFTAPKLTLIMVMTFPVIVIGAIIFGRKIKKMSRARQDELGKTNVLIEETFQAFNIVKSFTNEWFENRKFANSVDKIVSMSLKYANARGLFIMFVFVVMFGGIFFILWRGAIMVANGEMPIGDLFSFIIYTAIIGGSIAGIGNFYVQLSGAIGANQRVSEVLEMEDMMDINLGEEKPVFIFDGNLELKNVSFSYPSRKDVKVLDNINLSVDIGKKIALVGSSGAGKSTITQLLLRFYDINSGEILVDGKDIYTMNIINYRQNISIVPQDVMLFGGTIKENILYGDYRATEEELIEAAKKANAYDFIQSFPDGFDTIVGERGVKLSGGQRQRVAIARAILSDPRILILDEATSSLDAESEKLVQEALDNLMEGRTSIIIAHRLATIRSVDRIYVMDHGKIAEEGSHEELITKKSGIYSHLASLQFDLR